MSARNWWIKSKLLLKKVDILKNQKKVRKIRSGRSSQIVAVFPNIKSALYCDLCNQLQSYATSQGYQFYTAATNDSPKRRKASCKT